MRFKVDENLPLSVVEFLKGAGHDARSVYDQSLGGAADHALARVCRREQRALITLDLGFADIRTYAPQDYSGIIVFRLSRQDKIIVQETIGRLLPLLQTEILEGRLWIVDDERIRVRE